MKHKAHTSKNYKFTKKKHSGPGVAALVLSFLPLLLFFYAAAFSFKEGGHAPEKIGCIGIVAIMMALGTLKVSVQEAGKENVIKKVPIAGAIMSMLMLVGWGAVYVIGWTGL